MLSLTPPNLLCREEARDNSYSLLCNIHFVTKNANMTEFIMTIGVIMDCAIAEYVAT